MNPQSANQESLIAALKDDLNKVITTRVDGEAEREKQRQLTRLDKADAYYRGNPYQAESFNVDTGTMSVIPINSSTAKDTDVLDYNIDITKSYGRKYYSVLGTRPFHNVKALPDDPQSEEDRKAARQYELCAIYLKTKWNARVMNIMVFYHQWKSGNVYAFIDHVANKALWGETVEPVMEPQEQELEPAGYRCTSCNAKSAQPAATEFGPVCPECGAPIADYNFEEAVTAPVPVQVGEKRYANAGPTVELLTGYQVTVPLDTKSLDKAPWLLYEYEEHPGALMQLYREQLKPYVDEKTGEIKKDAEGILHEQGRRSRELASQIGGVYGSKENKTRWTYSRYWLSAFMYEYVQDEAKRKILYEQFPDGLKVTRVEGIIVKLESEAITDSWAVFQPEPGDYLYSDPMCWGILGHQDVTNDAANLMIQILEECLPAGFFDPSVIDPQRFGEIGNRWLPALPNTSGRIESALVKAPTASFPEHAIGMTQWLETNVQSHTGLLPAVFGGGEKSETAEEARTRLNQALMQLGVPGEFAGVGWKDALGIAIKKIAKFGLKPISIPTSSGSSEMFDLEALRAGNAHFENEPGVPMSYAERRDGINHIIGQNPAMASAFGFDRPINAAVMRDYVLPGMEDLKIPMEERREGIVEVIRELLKSGPIETPVDPMAVDGMGMPMPPAPPQPSILPEPGVDDSIDAGIVLDWLHGDAGRRAKRENPTGYANVVAYGMALDMLPPPMGTPKMPMPPPGEEPPMGGGGPKAPKPPQQPQSAAMPA